MKGLEIKENARFDLVSLGELLLRFDPGESRIQKAREFKVWCGGAEYNVASNLSSPFGKRTAIISALADNQIGRLAEGFALGNGVDTSNIVWSDADSARNGSYYIERGFGLRAPVSCYDRAFTAVSELSRGSIDWHSILESDGTSWLHTGGIFTGLSDSTTEAALEGFEIARQNETVVSFDLNYRDSLWRNRGGKNAANENNRKFLPFTDVVFGVIDFDPRLGFFDSNAFRVACEKMMKEFPNLKFIVTTLRHIDSASRHDLSAACFVDGEIYKAKDFLSIEVLDRVGSGDAFAASFINGLLDGKEIGYALDFAVAASCLSMTTPGDNLVSTVDEIQGLMENRGQTAVR